MDALFLNLPSRLVIHTIFTNLFLRMYKYSIFACINLLYIFTFKSTLTGGATESRGKQYHQGQSDEVSRLDKVSRLDPPGSNLRAAGVSSIQYGANGWHHNMMISSTLIIENTSKLDHLSHTKYYSSVDT